MHKFRLGRLTHLRNAFLAVPIRSSGLVARTIACAGASAFAVAVATGQPASTDPVMKTPPVPAYATAAPVSPLPAAAPISPTIASPSPPIPERPETPEGSDAPGQRALVRATVVAAIANVLLAAL